MDAPYRTAFGKGAPLHSLGLDRCLGIAILSTLGPLLYVVLGMLPLGCCEHKRHCDRLLDYSYGIGVNHIGAQCGLDICFSQTFMNLRFVRPVRDCAPLYGERGPATSIVKTPPRKR